MLASVARRVHLSIGKTTTRLPSLHHHPSEKAIEAVSQRAPTRGETGAVLEVLLEEYKTLRDESLAAIAARLQLITTGLVGVAAAAAGPFAVADPQEHPAAFTLVYSYAVPVILLVVLVLWIGEAMRSARVSDYMAKRLEPAINKALGAEALHWESALKSGELPRDLYSGASIVVVSVLGLAAVLSPVAGYVFSRQSLAVSDFFSPRFLVPWILSLVVASWAWVNRRRITGSP